MAKRITKWDRSMFVAAVMSNVPNLTEVAQKQAKDALRAAMAPEVRVAFDNYPNAVRWESFYGLDIRGCTIRLPVGNVEDDAADEIVEPFTVKIKERGAVQKALVAVVDSCNTWAQIRAALPEFARFIPDENAPTPNTPAPTGLAKRFMDLGLPIEART